MCTREEGEGSNTEGGKFHQFHQLNQLIRLLSRQERRKNDKVFDGGSLSFIHTAMLGDHDLLIMWTGIDAQVANSGLVSTSTSLKVRLQPGRVFIIIGPP